MARTQSDFKDLRDFLDRVDEIGELKTVENVDWNLELGGIAEIVAFKQKNPALLFDNIKGSPKGFRVIANIFGTLSRTALVLREPTNLKPIELVRAWKERLKRQTLPKPTTVSSAPVLENVDSGEKIDLLKFPAPRWHEGDGGRYIGTGDLVITRDPDEGWVNVGTYRVMVHDKKRLGLYISPGHHGRLMLQKYWEKGKNAPVAISVGHDPTYFACSILGAPWGVSEYDLLSLVSERPSELVEAPFTKLPVPATSEIVIEGECPPPDKLSLPEGPFGEWTGYYASASRPEPVVEVKSVLYRNNPIITGAQEIKTYAPGRGAGYLPQVVKSAYLWDQLEKAGVQGITGVWYLLAGGPYYFPVISLRQMYPGHARRAAFGVLSTDTGGYAGRFVIVVDDDIDPSNMDEVMWAMGSRCDLDANSEIVSGCWSTPLDPTIAPWRRERGDFTSNREIIIACRPYHWRDKFPKVVKISDQHREKLVQKWGKLLDEA